MRVLHIFCQGFTFFWSRPVKSETTPLAICSPTWLKRLWLYSRRLIFDLLSTAEAREVSIAKRLPTYTFPLSDLFGLKPQKSGRLQITPTKALRQIVNGPPLWRIRRVNRRVYRKSVFRPDEDKRRYLGEPPVKIDRSYWF